MEKKCPEIMSPAGDFVCLEAAIRAGADAVYFGARGTNMRAGARNFSLADFRRISAMCKEAKARSYITLNTIYFDDEISKLKRVATKAADAGIDAVIAWDFGAVSAAKSVGLPVFYSTQGSVANADSILALYEKFEISRFVLARECTLEHLKKIRAKLDKAAGRGKIGIEVFVHGAMCVSESGRCFLSQFSYGKSANRGECLQPCRRKFFVKESGGGAEFELCESSVFSPKDLCTLPFLDRIIDAGADSLKIEGRNRNAEYVFETTSAYKKIRDFYISKVRDEKNASKRKTARADFDALKATETERLKGVFNRGFSDGFFMGKPMGDWRAESAGATRKKSILGRVVRYFPKIKVAEISIDAGEVSLGDTLQIEGKIPVRDARFSRFSIAEMRVGAGEKAQSAKKGETVSFSVPEPVKAGDRVFVFRA